MVLYNVTVILEDDIETDWLKWVEQNYIDAGLSHPEIISVRLLKVLDSPNPGVTYCIQFVANDQPAVQNFLSEKGDAIMSNSPTHFTNKFVLFSTTMEFIINQ